MRKLDNVNKDFIMIGAGQYPVIPGIDIIGASFNPQVLDILYKDVEMRLPIVQITYSNNSQLFPGPNGKTYIVPDQAYAVNIPGGVCADQVFSTFHKSSFNFSQSFSAGVGWSSSSWFGLVSSSQSLTVGDALSFQINQTQQNTVGVAFCNVTTHGIMLHSHADLNITSYFAKDVIEYLSPNPKYEDNPSEWIKFFQKWGMAQPTSIVFGGVAGTVWWLSVSTFSEEGKGAIWASEQASASLGWFMNAVGGGSGSVSGASSEFLSSSGNLTETRWQGGYGCIPGYNCSYSQWSNSLFNSPASLYTEYISTTPFIAKADPNVTQGAEDAIRNITAVELLSSIIVPMFKIYASMLNNINISAPCESVEPPICSLYPELSCCTITYTAKFPNISIVKAKSAYWDGVIAYNLILAQEAINKTWISKDNFTSIRWDFDWIGAMWAEGYSTATCAITYNHNNNVPPEAITCISETTEICGYITEICLVPSSKPAPVECCDFCGRDDLWCCPTVCPAPSGVVFQQTAYWPEALTP